MNCGIIKQKVIPMSLQYRNISSTLATTQDILATSQQCLQFTINHSSQSLPGIHFGNYLTTLEPPHPRQPHSDILETTIPSASKRLVTSLKNTLDKLVITYPHTANHLTVPQQPLCNYLAMSQHPPRNTLATTLDILVTAQQHPSNPLAVPVPQQPHSNHQKHHHTCSAILRTAQPVQFHCIFQEHIEYWAIMFDVGQIKLVPLQH